MEISDPEMYDAVMYIISVVVECCHGYQVFITFITNNGAETLKETW